MRGDVHFSGPEPGVVTLRGVEYVVGPLTMRQRRRVMKSFDKVQRPRAAEVDVKGLVEAMFRVPDDPWLEAKDPIHARKGIEVTRKQIGDVVLQATREARAFAETWPPAPDDPRGIMLITQNPAIQQVFLFEVLKPHNPDFSMEAAGRMVGVDDDGPDESLLESEFGRLLNLVFPAPDPQAQAEANGQAGEDEVPKSSGSGGGKSTSPGRPPVAGASTTPASTSS